MHFKGSISSPGRELSRRVLPVDPTLALAFKEFTQQQRTIILKAFRDSRLMFKQNVGCGIAHTSRDGEVHYENKDTLTHTMSSLHFYCRLKDVGLSQDDARRASKIYEETFFRPALSGEKPVKVFFSEVEWALSTPQHKKTRVLGRRKMGLTGSGAMPQRAHPWPRSSVTELIH